MCDKYDLHQLFSIFSVFNYVFDWGSIGFDNRASSCVFNGIWILYDGYDFNVNNLKVRDSLTIF
jgi:hypothetical protein